LLAALHSQDTRLRIDVARALGRLDPTGVARPNVIRAVLGALRDGNEYHKLESLEWVANMIEIPEVIDLMIAELHGNDVILQSLAVKALARSAAAMTRPEVVDALVAILRSHDPGGCTATEPLGRIDNIFLCAYAAKALAEVIK
jgi:hypothetical protein